jgi:hypothetical protein
LSESFSTILCNHLGLSSAFTRGQKYCERGFEVTELSGEAFSAPLPTFYLTSA